MGTLCVIIAEIYMRKSILIHGHAQNREALPLTENLATKSLYDPPGNGNGNAFIYRIFYSYIYIQMRFTSAYVH